MEIQLTSRQRQLLREVVETYVQTGQPVGSRRLTERSSLSLSPSTVRAELATLETLGYLTHPHTSAGRVPTERGYRLHAEDELDRLEPRPETFSLELAGTRRGAVEDALRSTTEALARVTRLLALVSAPPLETATVRHVEVILLQPQVVMAVVITSAGGVNKATFMFDEPVDPGLVEWARAYLAEQVAGLQLGMSALRQRLDDPQLSVGEREFLQVLRPAFTDVDHRGEQRLFVGGAASLLGEARDDELEACHRLLEALEQRATLLGLMGGPREPRRIFVRVGRELEPALHDIALVGATYGLVHRTLGAVSLLGPVRMDYATAMRSVRSAAHELSRFVEEVYADN
jgi:heat-inducible transcriptional repressor